MADAQSTGPALNLTGFQSFLQNFNQASDNSVAQAQARQAALDKIPVGGPLGFFTDTPAMQATAASARAQLAAVNALAPGAAVPTALAAIAPTRSATSTALTTPTAPTINASVAGPATPADMAIAYARGQDRAARTANPVMSAIQDYMGGGGNLSLNMIGALAHAQAESSSLNKPPKVETAADKTFSAASSAINNFYNSQLAAAKGDKSNTAKIMEDYKNDTMALAHGVSQTGSAIGPQLTGNPNGS